MSKNFQKSKLIPSPKSTSSSNRGLPITSLLDSMEDGREFESLVGLSSRNKTLNVDPAGEIRRALDEIRAIRGRYIISYVSNIVNSKLRSSKSIDSQDDLPFSEMINCVPIDVKDIDIVLVTPGGSATQVDQFVDKLRTRFDSVTFIIIDKAMSAGTIFAMSGDEIIMTNNSYIGPIDPQVPNKDGMYMPAQTILNLILEIQQRGESLVKSGRNPSWTDILILKNMDSKEIGNAINASKLSVELVTNYLKNYKFRTWTNHSSNGNVVTESEKIKRAEEIANQLCDHALWKSHGRGISREMAFNTCKLKITHSESIEGLDRAIKRLWALYYWVFENTQIVKTFISHDYMIIRTEPNTQK